MYKVMIADDEKWILTGLKQIIDWQSLSLEIVHTALNGEEALHKFEQQPVDIVIVDINMPKLNGLELIKKIKQINDKTKFIILSGYDEFEYAKEAIRIGVEGYTLKPLNEDEIYELIELCIKKLNNTKYEFNNPKSKILLNLINGEFDFSNKDELNLINNIINKEAYNICIIKLDLNEQDINKIIDFIYKFKFNANIEILCENENELIILNSWQMYIDIQEVVSHYAQLQLLLLNDFNVEAFIAISYVITNIQEINKQYHIAKSICMYHIILGFDILVTPDILTTKKTAEINVDMSKIHKLIIEQNQTEVIKYIEDIIINNAEKDNISPDYLYHICIKIAILLDEIIIEFGIQTTNSIYILRNLIEQIYKANNISVLAQLLIQQIREVMSILGTDNSKYTPIIQQVINYVHNNYQDDMNLTMLADKYNMNSSYLGRLFLKEIGCSFAQYLNQIKNTKAKELILNTNMKINDIAKNVGYTDISYFYRKFKKFYGVSPSTLRDMKIY